MPTETLDLTCLASDLKKARERKGLTLQDLVIELNRLGYPTSQNRLWRMENVDKMPKRVDIELLHWLEVALETKLRPNQSEDHIQVRSVIEMIDSFDESHPPKDPRLKIIHNSITQLLSRKR